MKQIAAATVCGLPERACKWLSVVIVVCTWGCSSATADVNEKYFAAKAAASEGKKDEALRLLTEFIAATPAPYAYLERAKLYRELGEDQKALADCEAGLKLQPNHIDLNWYLTELKKDPEKRFQGKGAKPPSTYK